MFLISEVPTHAFSLVVTYACDLFQCLYLISETTGLHCSPISDTYLTSVSWEELEQGWYFGMHRHSIRNVIGFIFLPSLIQLQLCTGAHLDEDVIHQDGITYGPALSASWHPRIVNLWMLNLTLWGPPWSFEPGQSWALVVSGRFPEACKGRVAPHCLCRPQNGQKN